jgi:hypothetical protein
VLHKETTSETNNMLDTAYEAAIGNKNTVYYLTKFRIFDRSPGSLVVSWNWPAFFFGCAWALYRKMYLWAVSLLVIAILLNSGLIFTTETSTILLLIIAVAFGAFGNALYYKCVQQNITNVRTALNDDEKVLQFIRRQGGVNTWVIWFFCATSVIGIAAAIVLPAYHDTPYTSRDEIVTSSKTQPEPSQSSITPPKLVPKPVMTEEDHFNFIRAAHPDFEQVVNDEKFSQWVETRPEDLRETYHQVMDHGTANQVIDMLTAYKAQRNIAN